MKRFKTCLAIGLALAGSPSTHPGFVHAQDSKSEPAVEVIAVGSGSYASRPPQHEEMTSQDGKNVSSGKISNFLNQTLYINPELEGKPVPTNDWWTYLIRDRFSGNMWAYPFVIKATEIGVNVHLPNRGNFQEGAMDAGPHLSIRGKVQVAEGPTYEVLADFEGEEYPEGWKPQGEAFGKAPAQGSIDGQSPVSGFSGFGLANSFTGGDGSTGSLTSPPFRINQPYLHFQVAGGNHPGVCEVRLKIKGRIVLTATGDNSESLDWVMWDLSEHQGAEATLELIDESTGGWGHLCADQFILSPDSTPPGTGAPDAFQAGSASVWDWQDWTLQMRLAGNGKQLMDVTFGRGLPFVWFEFSEMTPQISFPAGTALLKPDGSTVSFPYQGNAIILSFAGSHFALFAPAGTTFQLEGGQLLLQHESGCEYLAVGALNTADQINQLEPYAYSVPRTSRFDWNYDPATGSVSTSFTLTGESLTTGEPATTFLQGFLPHHIRAQETDLKIQDSLNFPTPRGTLQIASGQSFYITHRFPGIAPAWPLPDNNQLDQERMNYYLDSYVETPADKKGKERYGADTYWGGKHLIQYAQYAQIAAFLKHPSEKKLTKALHDALSDWFTYDPDEKENYFARYDRWGALVGFNASYGSEHFTDHHFHYGYFTHATALLGILEPSFLDDYGEMATLVAKEYANWDREDTRFPFLRNFDPWGGHSYAGGESSPNGNNQESTSEAMQSWAGLFLLGSVLNDPAMQAAGAMGYAVEHDATREYWNDYTAWKKGPEFRNFPPDYNHTIVGIAGDSGNAYGTFFHGHPKFIYGIQWLPLSPGLHYLGADPDFVTYQVDNMLKEQATQESPFTFSTLGADWGNVTLGYLLMGDSARAIQYMDEFWAMNDPIAQSQSTAGLSYYLAHAHQALGQLTWELHTNIPTSLIFADLEKKILNVVTYNTSQQKSVNVYKGKKLIASYKAPAGWHTKSIPTP